MTVRTVARTVGIDLGTRDDWTAVVVLDQLAPTNPDPATPSPPPQYAVTWLHRRRGAPYTAIIDELAAMATWPALRGQPFVVDATGLGRPVVDALRQRVSNVHAVVLTGGEQSITEGAHESHVPKKDVVAAVQILLQSGRLAVDSRLQDAAALRDELLDFGYQITDTGRTTMQASTGQHDDLVLAAGLACWKATHRSPADAFLDWMKGRTRV